MNTFFDSLGPLVRLMAAPSGEGGGNPLISFLPLLAIVAIFYFLILRPQNKKQKETQRMLSALKKGDRIVTIGGIHGTIQTLRETTVIVRVDDNVKLEFLRSAISNVVSQAREDRNEREAISDDREDNTEDDK